MTVGLGHYLAVAAILFTLGILGIFINRKNVIVILMSIELMLLAVNINFVAFSYFLGDLVGQVFALFNLTVAAVAMARCATSSALHQIDVFDLDTAAVAEVDDEDRETDRGLGRRNGKHQEREHLPDQIAEE